MKRKFRTLISCLLIASLCIGLLSATALAADPVGTEARPRPRPPLPAPASRQALWKPQP